MDQGCITKMLENPGLPPLQDRRKTANTKWLRGWYRGTGAGTSNALPKFSDPLICGNKRWIIHKSYVCADPEGGSGPPLKFPNGPTPRISRTKRNLISLWNQYVKMSPLFITEYKPCVCFLCCYEHYSWRHSELRRKGQSYCWNCQLPTFIYHNVSVLGH